MKKKVDRRFLIIPTKKKKKNSLEASGSIAYLFHKLFRAGILSRSIFQEKATILKVPDFSKGLQKPFFPIHLDHFPTQKSPPKSHKFILARTRLHVPVSTPNYLSRYSIANHSTTSIIAQVNSPPIQTTTFSTTTSNFTLPHF